MRLTLWPQSLFGRLIAASVIAVLLANAAGILLIAREREHFILQGNVREWARRIAETAYSLQAMNPTDRADAVTRLSEFGPRPDRPPPAMVTSFFGGPLSEGDREAGQDPRSGRPEGPPPGPPAGLGGDHFLSTLPDLPPGLHRHNHPPEFRNTARQVSSPPIFIPLPGSYDFEPTLKQQVQSLLGSAYHVTVAETTNPAKRAVFVSGPVFEVRSDHPAQLYDVDVKFPDGSTTTFRVSRTPHGALLPRNLFMNLLLLVAILVIALYVTARSITRPLSKLAQAADSLGRDTRQPKLEESGARELRDAAHAFNTMQDRLHRYLDSRTRVLAAMSHDLKTPLTRLRLQVETLEDASIQARFGKELDEMESMVRGALALFRGLDDDEVQTPVDINELLRTLRTEFTEMGA